MYTVKITEDNQNTVQQIDNAKLMEIIIHARKQTLMCLTETEHK